MLRQRLERKCVQSNLVTKYQASGKSGAQTSYHLLVLKHLIHKYLKVKKQKMFVCFFDLKKAFDFVPRLQMFYTLMTEYKIGGQFLKILKNIYTDNQMFIKVDGGLTKPFITTTGVKQGCVFSPLLFNLYINKLPTVYDEHCDPVYVGNKPVHCLMWADDCVVMSTTQAGLQRSITKTVEHFTNLGLMVNTKKTKCMIFNPSGWGPMQFPKIRFHINGQLLENIDHYTYLGLIFKPSGSVDMAAKELLAKANRAYFSLSSLFYENKKMKVDRAIDLFDSLVTPVSLYSSQFWSVLSLPASAFTSIQNLMKAWEIFIPETVNQRFCRLLLSLHKKTSRLAVLGELGRYPMLITSLIQSLKYKWTIVNKSDKSSLVYSAVNEMEEFSAANKDCWLYRIKQIESLCKIKIFPSYVKADVVKNSIKKSLKSIFDRFYIDQINEQKIGDDLINYNKLRLYHLEKRALFRHCSV